MDNSIGNLEDQNSDKNVDSKYYANEFSERNEDFIGNGNRSLFCYIHSEKLVYIFLCPETLSQDYI